MFRLICALFLSSSIFCLDAAAPPVAQTGTLSESVAAGPTDYPPQWNLNSINAYSAWPYTTGQGVSICDIDTGADVSVPDLAPAFVTGQNFAPDQGTDNYSDVEGHGTFTASELVGRGKALFGVAPGAGLIVARALGSNGKGSWQDAINAVYYCADKGVVAINMSFGDVIWPGSITRSFTRAVRYACRHNIAIAVSSGNDGTIEHQYPAIIQSKCLIAVNATDENGQLAFFSNYQENPHEVSAPGEYVQGDIPGGSTQFWDGTSMAAPEVTGELALLRSLGLNAAQSVLTVENTACIPAGESVWHLGAGLINVGRAVKRAYAATHTPLRIPYEDSGCGA